MSKLILNSLAVAIKKVASTASYAMSELVQAVEEELEGKYDKSGGEIDGDVKVKGTMTLDIENDDYDAGVAATAALDNNLGIVVTLNGYANTQQEHTDYKPVLRNIATPTAAYEAANKKYVDDHMAAPSFHLVELDVDGNVVSKASSITYQRMQTDLTDPLKTDYLDCLWPNDAQGTTYTRFYIPCVGISEVNSGLIMFCGITFYQGVQRFLHLSLDTNDVLTTVNVFNWELATNKVQSVVSNAASTAHFPSTKAVYDEFQRKPVVVWETDGTGLTALETDMSASPSWQLTSLDFSPYKSIKVYTKAAQGNGTTASASTTPAIVLEMSLDARAAGPYGGHYLGSTVIQKSNDRNRAATLCCAVSADKTSFAVMRMTNLYGTMASDNSDVGGYVFKIVGYFD